MASKRRQRRDSCERKVKYTHREAVRIAKRLRYRTDGDVIDAYKCTNCGCYHVGHRPYKVSQRNAAMRARRQALE